MQKKRKANRKPIVLESTTEHHPQQNVAELQKFLEQEYNDFVQEYEIEQAEINKYLSALNHQYKNLDQQFQSFLISYKNHILKQYRLFYGQQKIPYEIDIVNDDFSTLNHNTIFSYFFTLEYFKLQ